MVENERAYYTFDYTVTLEEYVDFNIFASIESEYAKKMLNKRRRFHWLFLLFALVLVGINVYQYGPYRLSYSASCILSIYAALYAAIMLVLLSTPLLRKRVRNKAIKFSKKFDGVYSPTEILYFCEDHIYEISQRKEERIQYSMISRYHIDDNAIYIFPTPATAYILPRHVIKQGENDAFMAFLLEKLSASHLV